MESPGLGFSLNTSLRQEQVLLPQMLVAIEMLALPAQDLDRWLVKAAEENEALRVEPTREVEPALPDRDRDQRASHAPARSAAGRADASDRHHALLENLPEREPSLAELVEAELAFVDDSPEVREWVRFLAASLDDRGFLSASDEALLERSREVGLEPDAGLFGAALARLQSFEPRGLGARNAVEALLLQLDPSDADYALLCRLLEDFLEELAKNRLPQVARALDIELGELHALLGRLRELEFSPMASFADGGSQAIVPDVRCLAAADGRGGFEVEVLRSSIAACRLDPDVRALSVDRLQAADVRGYLRDKVTRARWILRGLQQRHDTLARVAAKVFERQHAFLERGPGHLLPLSMVEVGEKLGLATSTISRSVAGKYAQTPWGIFPLRHFFQAKGGDDVAPDELGGAVRALFESESSERPFSDEEAVVELAKRGFQLARRTVAKYRKELGIPSSYRRRRFA